MTTNEVTSEGLVTETLQEVIDGLTTSYQSVYGSDINLESNSPDGQMIGILAQLKMDLLTVIRDVYNSFDPDAAIGSALDQRVAINGIQRNGGSYTIAPVDITTDRALTLYGLDEPTETIFTVSDGAGNRFLLQETQAITGAGTDAYNFRAENIGAVQVSLNTITSQVTVIVGVTEVNNPDPAGTLGVDEESDADLKLRRQVSSGIGSENSLDSLRANLLNLENATDVYVHENHTGSVDGYSVCGHTIWPIVEGGSAPDIAQVIYAKRSAGCGMHGGESESVLRPNGSYFEINYDRPTYVPLHIHFSLTAINEGDEYDGDEIKAAIVDQLSYTIFETATSEKITDLLLSIAPLFIPTGVEVSSNGSNWFEILALDSPSKKYTVATGNITIV